MFLRDCREKGFAEERFRFPNDTEFRGSKKDFFVTPAADGQAVLRWIFAYASIKVSATRTNSPPVFRRLP